MSAQEELKDLLSTIPDRSARFRAYKLLQQLEDQILYDPLTGLLNEHGFINHLAAKDPVVQRLHPTPYVHYIAYGDLDRFKSINDTYGHAVGDLALKHIANILRSTTREADIIARLHGDEFAIALLYATSPDIVKQRIQATLAKRPLRTKGLTIPIPMTLEIAPYDPSLSPQQNLEEADRLMRLAKPPTSR